MLVGSAQRRRLVAGVALPLGLALASTAWGAAAPGSPGDRAVAAARSHASATALGAGQTLAVRAVVQDPDGGTHVRLDRFYRGLPVIGGDLVVHENPDGSYRGASLSPVPPLVMSTSPRVPAARAVAVALAASRAVAPGAGTPSLAVDAREARPVLAWEVPVAGVLPSQTPSELTVLVDASTGRLLESWEAVEPALGTGHGYLDGTVPLSTAPRAGGGFSLSDPDRGSTYTVDMGNKTRGSGALLTDADNAWGDGTLADRQSVAVDAQYGAAETWDYFLDTYGRLGIADDGRGSYNRVHYGKSYDNAFWSDSCFCMTYGDGDRRTFEPFVALDVVGHEMAHGVTSRTADLVYSGESGGLNEATSDIFGTMVERYAANPNDPADFLLGERLYRNHTGAIRYLHRPSLDGSSADCWYPGVRNLEVHAASGVANHFFYLLSEGTAPSDGPTSPTCVAGDQRVATGAGSLAGIGADAAQQVWYRALTVYMTSSTTYQQARAASLAAVTDLYGDGPERAAVAAAWTAVGVS